MPLPPLHPPVPQSYVIRQMGPGVVARAAVQHRAAVMRNILLAAALVSALAGAAHAQPASYAVTANFVDPSRPVLEQRCAPSGVAPQDAATALPGIAWQLVTPAMANGLLLDPQGFPAAEFTSFSSLSACRAALARVSG